MLKFSKANAKTEALLKVPELQRFLATGGKRPRKVVSLDILSGWSCPYAEDCLSKVHEIGGKRSIKDGPKTEFRCFSASQEALYPAVYNSRKHNYDLLRACSDTEEMYQLLREGLPNNTGIVRIHVAGDMFSQKYFDAWLQMATVFPGILFYAYTKSLPFWLERRDEIPENFVLTASRGGRRDELIESEGLREAKVVFSEAEAASLGYEIDHDDSHAAIPEWRDNSFALLLHGTQPKGSEAASALSALKGKGSYSKKRKAANA